MFFVLAIVKRFNRITLMLVITLIIITIIIITAKITN